MHDVIARVCLQCSSESAKRKWFPFDQIVLEKKMLTYTAWHLDAK
jgi:predicted transcriptional regulator